MQREKNHYATLQMGSAMQRNLCAPLGKPVLNRGTNKTHTQPFVDDNDEQGSKGNGRERD